MNHGAIGPVAETALGHYVLSFWLLIIWTCWIKHTHYITYYSYQNKKPLDFCSFTLVRFHLADPQDPGTSRKYCKPSSGCDKGESWELSSFLGGFTCSYCKSSFFGGYSFRLTFTYSFISLQMLIRQVVLNTVGRRQTLWIWQSDAFNRSLCYQLFLLWYTSMFECRFVSRLRYSLVACVCVSANMSFFICVCISTFDCLKLTVFVCLFGGVAFLSSVY